MPSRAFHASTYRTKVRCGKQQTTVSEESDLGLTRRLNAEADPFQSGTALMPHMRKTVNEFFVSVETYPVEYIPTALSSRLGFEFPILSSTVSHP
jgi:hypothetical protein